MKELMKLYDKMTPRELAITAFTNFVTNEDEDGVQRILAKVPLRSYTMTDVEWGRVMDTLFDIAKTYGWVFCELRAIRGESLGLAIASSYKPAILLQGHEEISNLEHFKSEECFDAFFDRYKEAETEMCSLHQAVKNLCEEKGLPLEQIRLISGVEDYELCEGEPKPEYVQKYAEIFQNICSRYNEF